MSWKPYTNAAGERIPSVTTITGRWKDAGGLIHWAWSLGMEGKDYRDVRDEAANAGTAIHRMVECHMRGEPFVREGWGADVLERAERGFGAFLEWSEGTKLEPVHSELRLISEVHQFGGTMDAVMRRGDRLALGDWKSGALYADHLYQVAGGYRILWEENYPDQPLDGGFDLCRFDKDTGDFSHKHFAELDDAREGFLLMRRLYEIDKRLKKRAK